MKPKEFLKTLRQKSTSELIKMQQDKEKEIRDLYFKNPSQKAKDLRLKKKLKIQLAQINTLLSEKTSSEILKQIKE